MTRGRPQQPRGVAVGTVVPATIGCRYFTTGRYCGPVAGASVVSVVTAAAAVVRVAVVARVVVAVLGATVVALVAAVVGVTVGVALRVELVVPTAAGPHALLPLSVGVASIVEPAKHWVEDA